MKELTDNTGKVVIENQSEVNKQVKNIGRLVMKPGQKLYELSLKEQLVRVIDVNKEVVTDIKGKVHKKVIIKEDHLYVPAINLRNAERKFLKMLG